MSRMSGPPIQIAATFEREAGVLTARRAGQVSQQGCGLGMLSTAKPSAFDEVVAAPDL